MLVSFILIMIFCHEQFLIESFILYVLLFQLEIRLLFWRFYLWTGCAAKCMYINVQCTIVFLFTVMCFFLLQKPWFTDTLSCWYGFPFQVFGFCNSPTSGANI